MRTPSLAPSDPEGSTVFHPRAVNRHERAPFNNALFLKERPGDCPVFQLQALMVSPGAVFHSGLFEHLVGSVTILKMSFSAKQPGFTRG